LNVSRGGKGEKEREKINREGDQDIEEGIVETCDRRNPEA